MEHLTHRQISQQLAAAGDADAWADYQSLERWQTFAERAMRDMDIDGAPPEDHFLFEEFIERFKYHADMALAQDLMDGMRDKGLVVASVDEDGEIIWELTREGEEAFLAQQSSLNDFGDAS